MALITSCPQCGTHFRVTPLHLQAHGGDVRCGRCSHVFKAFSRLSILQEPETRTLPEESPDAAEAGQPVKPSHAPTAAETPASPSVGLQSEPSQAEPSHVELPPIEQITTGYLRNESASGSDATTPAEEAPVGPAAPEASRAGGVGSAFSPRPDTSVQEEHRTAVAEEAQSEGGRAFAPAASTETPGPREGTNTPEREPVTPQAESKERKGRPVPPPVPPRDHPEEAPPSDAAAKENIPRGHSRRDRPNEPNRAPEPDAQPAYAESFAFESEPAGSFGWTLGSLLLLIIFTGQTIFFYSPDLAVAAPATKPYLEQYCELMGCSLSSPDQQQHLHIESSDMHSEPARPSVITLNATVRNYASSPQPLPLFELIFIDAQNRPLASRIFRPGMYLTTEIDPTGSVPPGKEFNARLHLDTTDLNPAGYRLSLFYPPPNPQS